MCSPRRFWSSTPTDAGKAVSMTTGQEMTAWATFHPPWWRSSANAQVSLRVYVRACKVVLELLLKF